MPAPLNCSPPPVFIRFCPGCGGLVQPPRTPSPGGWMRGLGLPPGTRGSPGGRGLPKDMGTPRTRGHRAGGGAGPSGTMHRDPGGSTAPTLLSLLPPPCSLLGGRGCALSWGTAVMGDVRSVSHKELPPSAASSFLGCGDPSAGPVTPPCCLLFPGVPRSSVPPQQPGARAWGTSLLGGRREGVHVQRGGHRQRMQGGGAGPGEPLTPSPPTPPQGVWEAWRPPRGPGVSPQPPGRRGGGLGWAGGPGGDPRAG